MVLTFYPHPVHVLNPEKENPLIVSLPYRLKLIEQLNIDVCLVIHFTKHFSRLSPEKFIQRYLIEKLHPKEIAVGDDFRFGQNRAGDLEYFEKAGRQYDFTVSTVPTTQSGKRKIGSSRIRQLILEGKLKAAAKLLNRPVSILGRVIRGDGRGKKLGYPTVNIHPGEIILPPLGVYIVRVCLADKLHCGIANIGRRPSFKRAGKVNVEVHIFDFNLNVYDKEITVEFLKKIRDERHFRSPEELIRQIRRDERSARWYFQNKENFLPDY